jgi:hypothetical protein
MGARGNSGVILSQILRGLTEVFRDLDTADAPAVVSAFRRASDAAYQAVLRPVEGTILTVVRETAEAAETKATAEPAAPLVDLLDAAHQAARAALERTPDLLPVLKEAGVVDAGGAGFALLLDALLLVVADRPLPAPPEAPAGPVAAATATSPTGAGGGHHHAGGDLRYEVMYLLDAPDEAVPAFKDVWAGIGDSIVVVGGDSLWNCHIHTDDVGAAIEAALDCGRPRNIRVTDLQEQVEEERWVRDAAAHAHDEPSAPTEPVTTGVVAVATGTGNRRILHSLGVHAVVAGGQSMNPSTSQILEAVEQVPADEVVVLPNNKNIVPVAEQVDALTGKRVHVVPTKSITEGFAALMNYDPQDEGATNTKAMTEAMAHVVTGEVTRAVRDSTSPAGAIAEGDWIGLDRDGIQAVAPALADAATGLLAHLVGDEHEIVTIIEGEGAGAADTRRVTEWLAEHRPHVTAEVQHGGQPLYPYLFGIE